MGINTDIYVSRVNSSYEHGLTWIEILRRVDGHVYMPEKIRLGAFEERRIREKLRRDWINKQKAEGLRLQGSDDIVKLTRILCYAHFEAGDPYDSLDALMAAVKSGAEGFFLKAEGFYQHDRFLTRQQFLSYSAVAMAEKVEQRAVLAARRKAT